MQNVFLLRKLVPLTLMLKAQTNQVHLTPLPLLLYLPLGPLPLTLLLLLLLKSIGSFQPSLPVASRNSCTQTLNV